jgi:SAM-dependent methyltransferase
MTASALEAARRSRRHPRPTQFDYLHLHRFLQDLTDALARLDGPIRDVLDVYCGSRPYDDLFPRDSRRVGLDVEGSGYGVADVVSNEFLPFDDASFDLLTCIEAFHYVEDPEHGVREMRRVLRPGGTALVSVPFVWEYDRTILERRYTGPELAHLFRGWEDVRVVENGGRGVAWATLTGTILDRMRLRLPRPVQALFLPLFLVVNGCGVGLDALDRRWSSGQMILPMNLLVTARRPVDG